MNKLSIIGGDLRIAYLANMYANENIKVYTYGLEKSSIVKECENIHICDSLKEAIDNSEIVISAIPLSNDGIYINTLFSDLKIKISDLMENLNNKIFIAGRIEKEIYALKSNKIIDLLEIEELTVLNAIASAEGTIQVTMQETNKTLNGSNILITGYGRITKILFNMLKGFGAKIYCETTKKENFSWIKSYGYTPILLENMNTILENIDIIINTAPHIIFDSSNLYLLKKDCVIVDIASKPGGVERKEAEKLGIKTKWELGLPGRVAPFTSAQYIKDVLNETIK